MASICNFFRDTCCSKKSIYKKRDIESILYTQQTEVWKPDKAVERFNHWKKAFNGHDRIGAIWESFFKIDLDAEYIPRKLSQSETLLVWLSEDRGCKDVSSVERLRTLSEALSVPCPSLRIFDKICCKMLIASEEEALLIEEQLRLEAEQKQKALSTIVSL